MRGSYRETVYYPPPPWPANGTTYPSLSLREYENIYFDWKHCKNSWVKEVKMSINSNLSLCPIRLYTYSTFYIHRFRSIVQPLPLPSLPSDYMILGFQPHSILSFMHVRVFLSVYFTGILLCVISVCLFVLFFPLFFFRWMYVPKFRKKDGEPALHVHSTTRSRSITNKIKISSNLKKY